MNLDDRKRVLIVEDKVNIMENYTKRLEKLDVIIDQATNKQEGLEKIHCRTYHIALIDVMLTDNPSDRGGLEITRKIQDMKEGTSVIVVSATNDIRVPVQAYKNQIVDYLIKKDITSTKIIVDKVSEFLDTTTINKYGNFDSLIPYIAAPEMLPYWHDHIAMNFSITPSSFTKFLTKLLDPFLPVLRKNDDLYKFKIDSKERVAESLVWSKAAGKAIFISIAKDKTVLPPPKKDCIFQIASELEQEGIVGNVYLINNATRSDYINSMYDEIISSCKKSAPNNPII